MILDEIAAKRQTQLTREMAALPLEEVRRLAEGEKRPAAGFAAALSGERLQVIAEVKKASPSKGLLCADFRPAEIARAYAQGGAAALSVLTEEAYFMGGAQVLRQVRQAVGLPILRKDFIIAPYQIYEARVLGADAVLLIAALLAPPRLAEYLALAHSLGLSCLCEVHDEQELEDVLCAGARVVGINNRNLKTFQVDLATTERLAGRVPPGCTVVAESGIATPAQMRAVRGWGADAVLVGESLVRAAGTGEGYGARIAAALRALREGT